MSYCRFSDDDFQCDVYVYESCHGGWQIHVAANRIAFKSELPPHVVLTPDNVEAYVARMRKVDEMIDAGDRVDIDLDHAGEGFNEPTPAACADRLEYLRSLGYRVPQYAIDALREESDGAA